MLSRPIRIAALLVPFFTVGCGAVGSPSPTPAPLAVTLVQIKTGPRREPLPDAELQQVFGGHFGNMQRLARERQLLVAGPYGKVKSDPALRGIFVLDTDDPARARQLAETDPGFQAGVFALDYHTLSTTAPLRAFLAAELAAQEAAQREGRTPSPGDGCRSYVLLTVDDGAAAERALAGNPAVLWFARLDGTRAFVLLDANDREAAQSLLQPVWLRLGTCRLDEWFASGRLAELSQLTGG